MTELDSRSISRRLSLERSFAEGKTPLGTMIEIEVQDPDIKGTIDYLAQSTVEVKE